MIYIADGPSDVPAWSVVSANGGRAFGVYQRGSLAQFEQISTLQRDGRIHAFAEADYTPDSTAYLWLTTEVRRIAEKIVEDRELVLRRAVRTAPRHVADAPMPPALEAAPEPEPEPESEAAIPRSRADEIRAQVRASLEDADLSPDTSDGAPLRR
jgi:hypothetical protein